MIIWVLVSNIFYVHPCFGEDFHFDSYFSDGLKPPARSNRRAMALADWKSGSPVSKVQGVPWDMHRVQRWCKSCWVSFSKSWYFRLVFFLCFLEGEFWNFRTWVFRKDSGDIRYMGVSLNGGTPKSSILIGISIINHPFWDTTILGNTHRVGRRLVLFV